MDSRCYGWTPVGPHVNSCRMAVCSCSAWGPFTKAHVELSPAACAERDAAAPCWFMIRGQPGDRVEHVHNIHHGPC